MNSDITDWIPVNTGCNCVVHPERIVHTSGNSNIELN